MMSSFVSQLGLSVYLIGLNWLIVETTGTTKQLGIIQAASGVGLPTQTILSLAVAPKAQGKGVATALLNELAKVSKIQGREVISLTCLEKLKPYYRAHGYVDEGIAESVHGGEVWYNMTFNLKN
jgi:GNAT superfamily N-acetyltransferase